MRSKLFVPGSRPELFAKALASEADSISFDLEDSVPDDAKARAREDLADFLRSAAARESGKVIIVRTNALATPHFEGDVMALACPQAHLLNLPKAGSAAEVREAAARLEHAERCNRLEHPIRLLVNIETPRAVRLAGEIADAHARVAGLQVGLADLFEGLRMERDARSVHAVLFAVRMAAGETGRFAYDGAFPDVADEAGFRAEAEQSRRLGYIGKSCIHPRQIAAANEIFGNDDIDVAAARRIVAAADDAAREGRGAFLFEGRMIDLPFIRRARAVLAETGDRTDWQ